MIFPWSYLVDFRLDQDQEKQYDALCREVASFVKTINKRLIAERKAKK